MSLLGLPQEVRDEVYTHLFPPCTRITVIQHMSYNSGYRRQLFELTKPTVGLSLSILRVCSQLHDEVLSTLLKNL